MADGDANGEARKRLLPSTGLAVRLVQVDG